MSFANSVERIWRDNILFSALVELTYRCNLDCFFCYNDLNLKGKPLTAEAYVRFFEDLSELGTLYLTLSGGEPIAHKDFFFLGRKARELGFAVRVKSNGHALRQRLSKRLKDEVDPFMVEVSLHGARPETHDRQTRIAGSFDRLMANLRTMLDMGLRLKVNSTLTAWNEQEIEEMFALADSLGLAINIQPEVSPRDDGDRSPLSISPTPEGILRLFRLQAARRREVAVTAHAGREQEPGPARDNAIYPSGEQKHCGAGSSGIAVDPFGNVYPCVQWRQSVGNLHEKSIKEIWSQSAELDTIRDLTVAAKRAVDRFGSAGSTMGFCPGLAHMGTGDPVRIYPAARLRMELHSRIQRENDEDEGRPIQETEEYATSSR